MTEQNKQDITGGAKPRGLWNRYLIEAVLVVLVLALDMLSKSYAALHLETAVPLIPKLINLVYVQNTGAAWGILTGARWFFLVITVILLGLLLLFRIKDGKEMKLLSRIVLVLIFTGALGNFIDRAFLGYVRDMISLAFMNFPVFNVADSSIVIGAGLMIIDVLFTKNSLFDVLEKRIKGLCGKHKTKSGSDRTE